MKKMLTVAGLTLLALAGCQSGGELKGDDVAPAEGMVNEVVLPPVGEITPVETTLPTDTENTIETEMPVAGDVSPEVNY
ncbi:MAG: hypothetical protein WCV72_03305 [Patescibacteria group bacterium]|jgi:hypothetical protein